MAWTEVQMRACLEERGDPAPRQVLRLPMPAAAPVVRDAPDGRGIRYWRRVVLTCGVVALAVVAVGAFGSLFQAATNLLVAIGIAATSVPRTRVIADRPGSAAAAVVAAATTGPDGPFSMPGRVWLLRTEDARAALVMQDRRWSVRGPADGLAQRWTGEATEPRLIAGMLPGLPWLAIDLPDGSTAAFWVTRRTAALIRE